MREDEKKLLDIFLEKLMRALKKTLHQFLENEVDNNKKTLDQILKKLKVSFNFFKNVSNVLF